MTEEKRHLKNDPERDDNMKLTQGQLKKIIREETARLMEIRGEAPRIARADRRIAGMEAVVAESEDTAEDRPDVFTEETADEREDKNIDDLWAMVRDLRDEVKRLADK